MTFLERERRIYSLTVQLDAKRAELHDAHRSLKKAEDKVTFYSELCAEKDKVRLQLIADHNDEKRRIGARLDQSLIPLVPGAVLGSEDRANAVRMAGQLAQLHDEMNALEKGLAEEKRLTADLIAASTTSSEAVDLERREWEAERQQLLDQIEALKGNPS